MNASHTSQVHILPELKDMAKEYGQPITDADGIAEVWVDDIAAWKIIVSDPKFVEKIVRKLATRMVDI